MGATLSGTRFRKGFIRTRCPSFILRPFRVLFPKVVKRKVFCHLWKKEHGEEDKTASVPSGQLERIKPRIRSSPKHLPVPTYPSVSTLFANANARLHVILITKEKWCGDVAPTSGRSIAVPTSRPAANDRPYAFIGPLKVYRVVALEELT